MPTNTYVALKTSTLTATATEVLFDLTGITGYTDLRLITNVKSTSGSYDITYRFNSDTNTNYSRTILTGNGTTAASYRGTSSTYLRPNVDAYVNSSTFQFVTTDIMNYSNATTYKTTLSRINGGATPAVEATAGLWSKAPVGITTISIGLDVGSGTFAIGSTFSLYGIAAEGTTPAPKATGGAIYSDSTYYYHVFGATGTFTPLSSLSADVLVVAGGGGGGAWRGGGGGAGGLLGFTSQSLTATGYTCTVGAGGAGGNNAVGSVGADSQFGALTLVKGGGYGSYGGVLSTAGNGGSGGGGVGYSGDRAGGTATSGQGNAGGTGKDGAPNYGAGGGGGAGSGATGGNGTTTAGGAGGIGVSTYSSYGIATGTGENVSGTYYYAGGGGGATYQGGTAGTGGSGGGTAGTNSNTAATSAQVSTGGGGGGGGYQSASANGGSGGSGVVIVRYLKV